jgi:Ca2+-binding EF-hand superfamily protein
LRSLFDSCDKDRSGYLERNEIKQLLIDSGEYPTDNRITQLINKVDENRDGKLNFNEFLQLYSNYRSNPSNAQFVDNNPSRPSPIQPVCYSIIF